MSLSQSKGTLAVIRKVWFESKCVHTTKHTAITGKIKYKLSSTSLVQEERWKEKKYHPYNYLLQFFEQLRSNIDQQKQGVGMFTPFKKKFICVSAGNKTCPQWIFCDVKAE